METRLNGNPLENGILCDFFAQCETDKGGIPKVNLIPDVFFFFQLENSGDPFDFKNEHQLSYWACVYFLIVTMSTVGYGDIYCETVLGRTFLVFFLLVGLVSIFFSFLPTLVNSSLTLAQYIYYIIQSVGYMQYITYQRVHPVFFGKSESNIMYGWLTVVSG